MEDCKYRLPCGRCDKFDKECDLLKRCEHNWEAINYIVTNDDIGFRSKCKNCGAIKIDSMKKILESTKQNLDIND